MDTVCIIPMSISADWVAIIVDLFIGVAVAGVLAYIVPKRLNNDRSLKDFFMQEFKGIKDEYNDFCKEMCLGKLSAKVIKETFKQIKLKLMDLQDVANQNLELNINVLDELEQAQIKITGSSEMNDQFNAQCVIFTSETLFDIGKKQELFNRNIISAIAGVNKAKPKGLLTGFLV